jgi:type IV pilus assembly PilN-like protein
VIGASGIGVEIGPRALRAVRVSGAGWRRRPAQVVEIAGDPATPRDVATILREHFGATARIAVALDLPLLCVKQVKLPALAATAKRRIVSLEPERFFATRGEDVVAAARDEDNLVFATREALVTSWIAALEELAPVELVEPGPAALVRALTRAGVGAAAVLRDGQKEGVAMLVLDAGRIVRARRVFGGLREAARALRDEPSLPERVLLDPWTEDGAQVVAAELDCDVARVEPAPTVAGVSSQFLPALGAALALDRPPPVDNSLAPADLAARIGRRRRRELAIAIVACGAALLLALSSADGWRNRALTRLQRTLPAMRERAAPALTLQSEILSVEQEAQTIRAVTLERPEPLRVLAALTRRLPREAYVRSLRFAGADWQIDGYAPNAARVLAELGGAAEFTDVHFLTATTRVSLGSRTYETFALAFRPAAAR